jgi:hypothetical protein
VHNPPHHFEATRNAVCNNFLKVLCQTHGVFITERRRSRRSARISDSR